MIGQNFKLNGYTLGVRGPSEPYAPPVAAMLQASYAGLNNTLYFLVWLMF